MTREEREKAIRMLNDMKVKIDIPKAAIMQNDKNWALDMAIKALEQEPCEDCISRAEMKEFIVDHQYSSEFCVEHHIDHSINTNMVLIALSDLPSVQPKTGHWIELKRNPNFECSKCHRWNKKRTNYCPNCGAEMEG